MENWRKPAACRVLRALFLDASFLSDYTHFPVENKAGYTSDLLAAAALCTVKLLFRNGMLNQINRRKTDLSICVVHKYTRGEEDLRANAWESLESTQALLSVEI